MGETQTVCDLIDKVRDAHNWSNEVLAAKLREHDVECSTSSVYNWARGREPNGNTARVLREVLQEILESKTEE